MKMKNLVPKLLLIAFLVGVAFWQAWPPEERIKLGKDLRGGVSLVYQVELPGGGVDSQGVLAQVIDALKRRVNPTGVLDISFQPQGDDRIEIVMPLPSPEVKAAQDNWLSALGSLAQRTDIRPRTLDRALAAGKAADLAPAPAAGATADPGSLRVALERMQKATADLVTAREEYVAAIARNADADELGPIEDRIASSELLLADLRQNVLSRGANLQRLKRAMTLPVEAQRQGETSPREVEMAALKLALPDYSGDLDALAAAYDTYAAEVTGYDDPEDLKRLLRAAGVLEFHITVSAANPEGVNPDDLRQQLAERGPDNTDSTVARWFRLDELKQWYEKPEQLQALLADPQGYFRARDLVAAGHEGQIYILLYTTDKMSMTHGPGSEWAMSKAFRSQDELGRQAVAFQLDAQGGMMMGKLTAPNVHKPMAIVLDGRVYSAPTLQSQISGNGQISGNFTDEDIGYLVRVLEGGELEAKLLPEPVSVSILGPAIGRDNLLRGRDAVVYSVLITALVMLLYYFGAGVIADIALALNAILIFGITAMVDGTFTLPGLAGIALSVAMAVDANVLIYERIREELVNNKEPLRNAIRIGYARALAAIVDGNITNLIVCIVLYKTAGTEVKGFALTMTIGVLTTLFTALFCTRAFFAILTEVVGIKSLPMLPTTVPIVARLLHPRIDWISVRWPIWIGCIGISIACLAMVIQRGREMLETEFRGGLTMTMSTRQARQGEPAGADGRLILARPVVEDRIHALGNAASADHPELAELRSANVLTVGETTADFGASTFQVKVANPAQLDSSDTLTDSVVSAVAAEFGAELDIIMPVSFTGGGNADGSAHTRPLMTPTLGASIGRAGLDTPVGDFSGGVAILLENLNPSVTTEQASARIARMRLQPDFSAQSGRTCEVIGLDPVTPGDPGSGYRSLAVLVVDPAVDLAKVDAATWSRALAEPEWALVSAAFSQKISLDQVSSFSPRVAQTLAEGAVVAIILSLIGMLLYIWLRFASFRYSLATVLALCFNMSVCLGALALSTMIGKSELGAKLHLEEFRIDLNVVSALLTIIGYSLNDTIVILDRIRENKGKLAYASRRVVNDSINQTFSRTVLTGGSTIATAIILYELGGTGIRPFAFTFLVGLIAGTISSVVVAAPLAYSRRADTSKDAEAASGQAAQAIGDSQAPSPA